MAMQAIRGRGVKLLIIIDLGTTWSEWPASRLDRALPPRKGTRYPLGGGWVGP
jgi:hypothetical protein